MYNNLCLSNSKSNNFKIKNQLYPPTPHKLNLSLCARRHIRLEHHSFIDVCLRQHSVPHSRGSSLHCSAQPPPLVPMFLGVSSPTPLRCPHECHGTVICLILIGMTMGLIHFHLLLLTTDVFFFCHLLCCHVSSLIWVSLISGHCSHSLPSEILCLEHKISTALYREDLVSHFSLSRCPCCFVDVFMGEQCFCDHKFVSQTEFTVFLHYQFECQFHQSMC